MLNSETAVTFKGDTTGSRNYCSGAMRITRSDNLSSYVCPDMMIEGLCGNRKLTIVRMYRFCYTIVVVVCGSVPVDQISTGQLLSVPARWQSLNEVHR